MKTIGPVEFLVVAFPGDDPARWVATAVRKVEVNGDVRIIDALLVVKAADGGVRTEELSDVASLAPVSEAYGLSDLDLALIGADDADQVATALDPPSTALALLVEHVWVRETAEAVSAVGGRLLGSVRVPYEYVADAMADLAVRGRRMPVPGVYRQRSPARPEVSPR